MSLVDRPGRSEPVDRPARRGTEGNGRRAPAARVLLLATLPAVFVGIVIRAWVMRSPLMPFNSDEATTGLQAFGVLDGEFRLIVAGNAYGATTESYLLAPLLTFWTGVWPLRVGVALLSVLAAYALFRLARPLYGRTVAVVIGLVGWTTSAAMVIIFSRAYLGYPTGFIALICALALAGHAMRSSDRLPITALAAGFAAGFALWSHPMFGVVAVLALMVPTVYRVRSVVQWWLPAVAGGLVGLSPWLWVVRERGLPDPTDAPLDLTYLERIGFFATELLPRMFGLLTPDGSWLTPSWLSVGAAVLLLSAAFGGLVLVAVREGSAALPVSVAGFLAFPALALFPQLTYYADARYALPFLPMLLIGIGAWSLLLPERVRTSAWLVATVPVIWSLALCVPVLHEQIGWTVTNPDAGAEQALAELEARDVRYLAGDYWGTYLLDYLADGTLDARPDAPIRFVQEADRVDAADPAEVVFVYETGSPPKQLRLPLDSYDVVRVGGFDLYLPPGVGR